MSSIALMQLSNSIGSNVKDLSDLKKIIIRPLIQLAVKSIDQEHIEDGILDRISNKYNVPQDKIDLWYSVILKIMKIHLRFPDTSIKISDFKPFLQELKMESDCIEDLCAVLYGHKRPVLIHSLSEKNQFYPTVKSCRWRVDVTISSSLLSRVLEPTILIEWTLSTGMKYLFELKLSKFHLMRHTVVSLLLKMHQHEDHNSQRTIQGPV